MDCTLKDIRDVKKGTQAMPAIAYVLYKGKYHHLADVFGGVRGRKVICSVTLPNSGGKGHVTVELPLTTPCRVTL